MDKDEAIHEVEEIKRVIDDTHKRSDHRKYWFALAAALAVLVCVFAPVLAPLIGIGFIVWGVTARLRSNDSLGKAIAIGALLIGIVLVIIGLFVIFSLMGWLTTTSTTIRSITITPPP
jgi:hypothetical protein